MSKYAPEEADNLYEQVLEAMGNSSSAKQLLDNLLELEHCASCDMHACDEV